MIEVEFHIWIASKTRWVHLTKVIEMEVVPRVDEYMKFTNAKMGDYIPWKITQVTYREGSEIAVWTGLLNNADERGYSFEAEEEFDEYYASYLAEGWQCKRGIKPNTRYRGE